MVASLQAATDLNSAGELSLSRLRIILLGLLWFSAFSAVRVWAIWSRNWVIFVIVMVACLLAPILNVVSIVPLALRISHQNIALCTVSYQHRAFCRRFSNSGRLWRLYLDIRAFHVFPSYVSYDSSQCTDLYSIQ